MLRILILSVVVAVAVTLGCMLLGIILVAVQLNITVSVGQFLEKWGGAIGVLSGLWFFFSNSDLSLGNWRK